MSEPGNLQFNIDNIRHPENYAFNKAKKERHAEALPKPPVPPAKPDEPAPPPNTKQAIAAGLQKADAAAQAVNEAAQKAANISSMIADPGSALAAAGGAAADAKMGELVSGLAKAIGPFPAATLTGLAHGHSSRARQAPSERSAADSPDSASSGGADSPGDEPHGPDQ